MKLLCHRKKISDTSKEQRLNQEYWLEKFLMLTCILGIQFYEEHLVKKVSNGLMFLQTRDGRTTPGNLSQG